MPQPRSLRSRASRPVESVERVSHLLPASTPTAATGLAISVAARWTLRLLILMVGLVALLFAVGSLWSIVLPTLLAVLLSTILRPISQAMARQLPNAVAASLTMVGFVAVLMAIVALLAPNVRRQGSAMLDESPDYVTKIESVLTSAPFGLGPNALSDIWATTSERLEQNSSQIMDTLISGVAGLGTFAVTSVLTLVLTFFIIKDAQRFTPWLTSWTGSLGGPHARELASRIWRALSSFIRAQATVGLFDAVLIGVGLWLLKVPFALTLAVLIFFAAFVPIVGAFATGFLAVLIALIAQGPGVAVAVFILILLVQQLEMNVTQPLLLGHALSLHPAAVLGAVTVGGTLFGIIGALLAVPALSVIAVSARYAREVSAQASTGSTQPRDEELNHVQH
ncbi:AI-2E family transporter [Ornithinimicrobium sp. Arc0846-15]|nr:AI-2E family transporter [Ornithinimicrobium laminariae]